MLGGFVPSTRKLSLFSDPGREAGSATSVAAPEGLSSHRSGSSLDKCQRPKNLACYAQMMHFWRSFSVAVSMGR